MRHYIFTALLLSVARLYAQAPSEQARMAINLLDYVNKDYSLAVQNGEAINDLEYAEMQEFAKKIETLTISLNAGEALIQQARFLNTLINSRASHTEISALCKDIRGQIITLNLVAGYPAVWPDIKNGRALFVQHCATCHGLEGDGQGLASEGLLPPPTNFRDENIMRYISPFQAFNTMRLGIPGTAMAPYNQLSESNCWDMAFYIVSIRHGGEPNGTTSIPIAELSMRSDDELQNVFAHFDIAKARCATAPKFDRLTGFAHARNNLNQALEAYNSGANQQASDLALDAYLSGIEPLEHMIQSSDNKLFQHIEEAMLMARTFPLNPTNNTDYEYIIDECLRLIDLGEVLIAGRDQSFVMTAIMAASILIREALEAFFVILAILGVIAKLGVPMAERWIHTGWISAVFVGIIGWIFTDRLLEFSPQNRELMEGLIGLFAVGVLIYLGWWMHGKAQAAQWKEFVKISISKHLNKNNMVGLGLFSFMVVFREAFESVLFLSTLSLSGGESANMAILSGAIFAALFMLASSVLILKWFKILPVHKVFLYSSLLMLVLSVVLCGQGIHALQEGAFIPVSSFPINLKIGFLGIYPTWESITAQAVLAALVIIVYLRTARNVSTNN